MDSDRVPHCLPLDSKRLQRQQLQRCWPGADSGAGCNSLRFGTPACPGVEQEVILHTVSPRLHRHVQSEQRLSQSRRAICLDEHSLFGYWIENSQQRAP